MNDAESKDGYAALLPTLASGEATLELSDDEAGWLKKRRIGSSDVPGILGAKDAKGRAWGSALEVYAKITGSLPPTFANANMRWGHYFEVGASTEFERGTGARLVAMPAWSTLVDARQPYLSATPDRIILPGSFRPVEQGAGILEIKSTFASPKEWADEVPESVVVQMQHQFLLTGLRWGYCCTVFRAEPQVETLWYEVERDDEFLGAWRAAAAAFDERCRKLLPPEPDSTSLEAIKRMYPKATDAAVAQLDEADAKIADQWQAAKDGKNELEKVIEACEVPLRAKIGASSLATLPDGRTLTLNTTKRAGYVVKATEFRTLRLKAK